MKLLLQVSWIVAPTWRSEHAQNHPQAGENLYLAARCVVECLQSLALMRTGEDLSAQLIAALKAFPDVYAKTVFLINYDEGGKLDDVAF